jgi:hypothetical protein
MLFRSETVLATAVITRSTMIYRCFILLQVLLVDGDLPVFLPQHKRETGVHLASLLQKPNHRMSSTPSGTVHFKGGYVKLQRGFLIALFTLSSCGDNLRPTNRGPAGVNAAISSGGMVVRKNSKYQLSISVGAVAPANAHAGSTTLQLGTTAQQETDNR